LGVARVEGVDVAKNEMSVLIDRPVEEVWKFVSDLSKNGPKIDPTILEMKQTSSGPIWSGYHVRVETSKGDILPSYQRIRTKPRAHL